MAKPIQEQFGQKVIDAFAEFARSDLPSVSKLEGEEFKHVSDPNLRHHLAQVFYGSRWIYKLGLALLTTDEERAAHIRAQLVDYGAVVEALLSDAVRHGIDSGHTKGDAWKWRDPDNQKQPLDWRKNPDKLLGKQSFWWLIRVAEEFGVVDTALAGKLNVLRDHRNKVHVRHLATLGTGAYLSQSRDAYTLVYNTVEATRHWRTLHPTKSKKPSPK